MSPADPHPAPQHPNPARPSRRSDATRAAILAAARVRFGADGYERATIRAIAADAGIDPAMVMRYYGSKAGLFGAAVALDLRLPDPAAIPEEAAGHVLAAHFLGLWEGESGDALAALLRAAATNEEVAEQARRIVSGQLAPLISELVADPAEAPVRTTLIASQLLGLALTRLLIRMPPMVALSRAQLVGWAGPVIQRYLRAPIPEPVAEPADGWRPASPGTDNHFEV